MTANQTIYPTGLVAHSPRAGGRWHSLAEHLRGSAQLARAFTDPWGAGDAAEYLALVHDVGKGACAWQDGLVREVVTGQRAKRPSHKDAGALLATRCMPWPLAAVVEGHHGGLRAGGELRALLKAMAAAPDGLDEAIARVAEVVPEIHPVGRPGLPAMLSSGDPTDTELAVRMVFSAVVDADRLDTASHFRPHGRVVRADADMVGLLARWEEQRKQALASRRPSPVDAIRQDIYEQAVRAAAGQPGIYRLHVPTGGGKTFAGMGFGLHHAAAHGLRRVVVAVPYISITEQNAAVYRTMLGPETVLEHHSAADLDDSPNRWARLAAENWDAPVVVTTTVRLLESLFDRRPGNVRRLHRLAGAVIVLDEVQALPDRLLTPILSALRSLVAHYGTTVVLSSATQPHLATLHPWGSGTGVTQHDIVTDPGPLFDQLRRVAYEWRTGPATTLASVSREVAQHDQALMILGTTKDANVCHRTIAALRPGHQVLHLSTRMTGGHRHDTIADAKQLLAAGQSVTVVSTSLIEAGVDLDFPRGYRARTLPESEQQAAGRVNREGHHDTGHVVIFDAQDAGQPWDASYRTAMAAARQRFGPGLADPDDLTALTGYYRHRYRAQMGNTTTDTSGATGEHIERARTRLDYPTVADEFRVIVPTGVSVVVIRPALDTDQAAAVRAAIHELRTGTPTPETFRALTAHTATIPRKELNAALATGTATAITADLAEWTGPYHAQRGIEPPQP